MVSKFKFSKSNLTMIWVGFGILIPATLLFAQDEINEPAGDVAAADDSEPTADTGTSESGLEEDSEEAELRDDEQNAEPGATAAPGETDEGQIGPVWDSYNDNMKSVAQEVTKGLRVEDVIEPPTEYHYAAFGKPDPFIAPLLARQTLANSSTVSGLEVPIVSPLQRHEISALRLVGIWQLKSGERKALILTPQLSGSDAGIIVRNGDSVGNRAGKILAIGDTFLTVREFKLAVDGTRQYEDIQMLMGNRDLSATPGKIRFTPGEAQTEVILEGEQKAVPVEAGQENNGALKQNPTPGANNQSGLIARSTVPTLAPTDQAVTATPAAGTPAAGAPVAPAAKTAQPIADPKTTGIAPVAGQPLPPSMNGTAPQPIPTQPPIKSPYIPAP